ncbi:hypothetical protein BV22DRAFT_1037255 [Leucogyrophana mollusca]|uniref:Uncharacterized protein n=1 Tax=Leucogyrophana mollusca TaxID=85980 RepID=A0ACB8BBU6_9AGAM|nr:hypothetical protein BV22DRAFT_1037255 [Leucogyrophana mollusca]
MATYSAFFSSGLLAPYRPSIDIDTSAPCDRDLSVTPTPSTSTSNTHLSIPRPHVRKRRSSINIAASPIALIKSPTRNAASALQRTGLMSPTRSRAGSVNEACDGNSLFGRMRSGSLNIRSRRTVRKTNPTAPPPTAPLPALPPPSPSAKYTAGTLAPPPTIVIPAPRRPLALRGYSADNAFFSTDNAFHSTDNALFASTLLSPDFATTKHVIPPRTLASSPAIPEYLDEEMKEN